MGEIGSDEQGGFFGCDAIPYYRRISLGRAGGSKMPYIRL